MWIALTRCPPTQRYTVGANLGRINRGRSRSDVVTFSIYPSYQPGQGYGPPQDPGEHYSNSLEDLQVLLRDCEPLGGLAAK